MHTYLQAHVCFKQTALGTCGIQMCSWQSKCNVVLGIEMADCLVKAIVPDIDEQPTGVVDGILGLTQEVRKSQITVDCNEA